MFLILSFFAVEDGAEGVQGSSVERTASINSSFVCVFFGEDLVDGFAEGKFVADASGGVWRP